MEPSTQVSELPAWQQAKGIHDAQEIITEMLPMSHDVSMCLELLSKREYELVAQAEATIWLAH